MSPEGLAYALDAYIEELQMQADTAQAFFYGHIGEGVEGLLHLPEEVRLHIDQLIWESAGGEAIDPTDENSGELITNAILMSLEERMGLFE